MRIVVDTSVVMAVIVGEEKKARLIELTKDASIVAPPSIDWEIGNAFSAMLKRSRLDLEQAVKAIEIYQEISLEIVEIDLKNAVKLAGKYNIYAYDAYVLQCAIENSLPLLTLDEQMINVAKREGIQVIEVEQ